MKYYSEKIQLWLRVREDIYRSVPHRTSIFSRLEIRVVQGMASSMITAMREQR
jgi:hypothetical protein